MTNTPATFRPYAPDWLDDEGAAYALSLPVSTFRQYVEAGMLPPPVKNGGSPTLKRTTPINPTTGELKMKMICTLAALFALTGAAMADTCSTNWVNGACGTPRSDAGHDKTPEPATVKKPCHEKTV